jgi:ribonucleoside-diphosphate reductase alpha chain
MDKVATKKPAKATTAGAEQKTYSFDEAYAASTEYFFGDKLAANVWCNKYAMRSKDGEFLEKTPHDMHDRLAGEFARIDSEKYGFDYDERFKIYRKAMNQFSVIVPQGSPMAAVGNTQQIMSASNCVVVEPPHDSIAGIMKTGSELAQLYKRRCGVGTDLSELRPDGFPVNNAARTTSGAWSFADYYSYITRMIGQCLHEDTQVLTRKGLKRIKKVTITDEVWTAKGWVPVKGVIENTKPCVRVTTKFGHEIICSEDHVFHTTNGEKAIKDLAIGDPITQIVGESGWEGKDIELRRPRIERSSYNNSNRLNVDVNFPKILDEKLAYVVGYSYGDGSVAYDEIKTNYELSLALDPAWEGIITKTKKYISESLHYDKEETSGDGCKRIRISSKLIIDFLRTNEFLKQKSEDIIFPEKLLKAKSSVIFAFISGYFDADGDVTKKKSYRFRSVRREFLAEIQNVLFAHGIPSKIHTRERKEENWRTIYTLSINGGLAQANFRKFMKESVKVASYPEFEKVRDFTRTAYQAKDFGTKASQHKYIIDDRQRITYSTSRRLCDDLNIEADYYLLQDQITGIELYDSSKHQKVYDLILPDEHLFFANGMYAHNSGRRGALMLTLDVHHPDVEKFATMKADLTKVTGANVSVRLSDEFMKAVEDGTTYEQRWPCEGTPQITQQVDARQIWENIIEMATKTAEPGLIFWDRITGRLPAHSYPQFKTRSTNPCSEIALSAYDSCRLVSLNLTGFVKDAFTDKARFDFDSFKENTKIAQHMVDNLVDIELQLIEKNQEVCSTDDEHALWQKLWKAGHDGRRTGLGTHGLGDMLAQIGIKYDSQEALDFGDKLYEALRDTAYLTSVELAETRGAFPAFDWELEKDNEYIRDLPEPIRKRMAKSGRRNISLLTQAPTGTVSLVSKCGEFDRHNISSGVEPVFRNNFTRRKRINVGDAQARVDHTDDLGDQWQEFEVYHGNVLNYFEKTRGVDLHDLENEETQLLLTELTKELPDCFTTSDQVDWNFRVDLQGTEQHYIDHSISSTINLPRGTKPETVSGIYLEGWKRGLKGVTVYVDGSRDGVLISKDQKTMVNTTERPTSIVRLQAPKRPKVLEAEIHHHTVKGEKWIALVGLLNGAPYEMFGGYSNLIHLPKKYKKGTLKRRAQGKYDLHIPIGDEELVLRDIIGTFNDDEIGWTTRLVSTSLRHGTPLEFLVEQLQKAGGGFNSFSKVLGRVLKKYIPDGEVKSSAACQGTIKTDDGEEITCNSTNLKWQEGCPACADCGYTKCN